MAAADPSRGLVPWVGIAAPLDPLLGQLAIDGTALAAGPMQEASGRAFCFLPLPIATGLPRRVHINAYFELSSNRRDIWCVHDWHTLQGARLL